MKEGWGVIGNSNQLSISKDNVKIIFDIVIKTQRGQLFCVNIQRDNEVSTATLDVSKDKAHKLLGHSNEESTIKSAKHLGWKLMGTMSKCNSCMVAKAKQKSVPQVSEHVPAKQPGNRFYLDLSKIKKPDALKTMGKSNWLMIVDELSKLKFSSFRQTKNNMIEPMCVLINKLKSQGYPVTYIRCDNAGENKSLNKRCNDVKWKLNIDFEYTARATPQQNSLAEMSFTIILNKAKSMLEDAHVPYLKKYKIIQEAILTATKLDGLVVSTINDKTQTRYEYFGYPIPKFAKYLKTWEEAGVVKTKEKPAAKLRNNGTTCTMVGYADQHHGDCYHM